jgi:uncharacterized protein (TIGR03435 family)
MKRRTRWLLAAAAGMATFSLVGLAQATAGPAPTAAEAQGASSRLPAWEIVSVKPAQIPCSQSWLQPTPDGMKVECLSVLSLVKFAFEIVEDSRILDAPSWLKENFYNIDAKVSGEDAAAEAQVSGEQRLLMLQVLLADRFMLKSHRETRELPIYALVVAKGGSKMKKTSPDEVARARIRMPGKGELDAVAISVDFLPQYLRGELDRPVVDKTGLTGKYDFTLRFAPGLSAEPDSDAVSIFTAVQEQVGLRLEPSKAPLSVLVIDHVEKPSAN